MFKFFGEHKAALGLDIGDVSLKLVELAKGEKVAVRAYANVEVSNEIFADNKLKDGKLLSRTIRQALARPQFGKVTTREVVASVPETKCFVRVIEVPSMPEEEAAEAIPWEAEAYVPLPLSQLYLDWLIIKQDGGTPGKMLVLLTAAPKDYIDDLVEVLKDAGLRPLALEVESQATARSLIAGSGDTVLVVDMDTVRASFIISVHGVLHFTSSVPIGGRAFTESIARAAGVDFAKAEKLKRDLGLMPDAKKPLVRKALLPILNNLTEEIKNTIRFYEEHSQADTKISRMLLTGGATKLKHLPSFLQERLMGQREEQHTLRSLDSLKVELGNPWINLLKKGQTPPLSREESLSYATAIGLALRGLES